MEAPRPKAPSSRESDDPVMLTRAQVAARLGISVAEVKRRERVGLIEPAEINGKGWHLYSVDQLDAVRNCTTQASRQKRLGDRDAVAFSGDEAAQVFIALDRKMTLRECVTKFALHPSVVEAIARAWARLDDGLFVSGEVMRKINDLPLDGTFPITSDDALFDTMNSAAGDSCRRCKRKPRALCIRCAAHHSSDEL
jgi:hypothetical protein